jgi:hypothetical protein
MPNDVVIPTEAAAQRRPRLEIVYRPIDELKPDPRNSRRHSKKQIRQLDRSIQTFGFTVPALIDDADNVIAGHARIMACRELGWSEIPTITIRGLSEAQIAAYRIADNRLAENAEWDERLLAENLKELSLAELDFSIEITGFEMGEIDMRIAGLDGEVPAEDPADTAPEPASGPPVSQPGDLWHLGDHHVLCGNVLDTTVLDKLIGAERAAMVFTDPPYNVPIDGHTTGLGRIHHRSFAMAVGEMSASAFTVFLAKTLRNLSAPCFGGALLYVCMDWRHIAELLAAGRDIGLELENLCVWAKDWSCFGKVESSP